jgi:hypothetical protein
MERFKKPAIGSKVRVHIKMDTSHYKIPNSEWVHEGTVVEDYPWAEDGTFALTSGLPAYAKFPVRTVTLSWVTNLEYLDGSVAEKETVNNATLTFSIEGSGKNVYTVTKNKDTWSCNCVAGQFRRACKHVKKAQELLG